MTAQRGIRSLAFAGIFVLLWSTGFIGAKYGLPYAPPLTFLLYRFILVAALMTLVALATQAPASQALFWTPMASLPISRSRSLKAWRSCARVAGGRGRGSAPGLPPVR